MTIEYHHKLQCINSEIRRLETLLCAEKRGGSRQLIVSSGDISSVDGLYALAEYAKTGADVIFVMNYPAYLLDGLGNDLAADAPGLGYTYSAAKYLDVFNNVLITNRFIDDDVRNRYNAFMLRYTTRYGVKGGVKHVLTEIAFRMVKLVWEDGGIHKGSLFFCIGGINSLNPFSALGLNNEIFLYRSIIRQEEDYFDDFKEHDIFSLNGKQLTIELRQFMSSYDEIRIDFNGSMAFLSDEWVKCIRIFYSKIKGAFVMGGVNSYGDVITGPASLNDVSNRFGCATINQFYSPKQTYLFFLTMSKLGIPVFIVSNDVVLNFKTTEQDNETKTDDGWISFLKTNKIYSRGLAIFPNLYYNSKLKSSMSSGTPADYYTAFALREHLEHGLNPGSGLIVDRKLFFDYTFGVSIISKSAGWHAARKQYLGRNQREMSIVEKDLLGMLECMNIDVFLVGFEGGGDSGSPLRLSNPV